MECSYNSHFLFYYPFTNTAPTFHDNFQFPHKTKLSIILVPFTLTHMKQLNPLDLVKETNQLLRTSTPSSAMIIGMIPEDSMTLSDKINGPKCILSSL